MNPELTYRLETARVLDARLREAETAQECSGKDLAFHRALKFWRNRIIQGLQLSCEQLAPIRSGVLPNAGGELGEFIRSLEYGELPAPKDSTTDYTDRTDNEKIFERTPRRHSQQEKNRKVCQRESPRELGGSGPGGRGQRLKPSGEMRLAREKEDPTRVYDENPVRVFRATADRQSSNSINGNRDLKPATGTVALPSDEKSREIMAQWR